jgi:hypothetical protein
MDLAGAAAAKALLEREPASDRGLGLSLAAR